MILLNLVSHRCGKGRGVQFLVALRIQLFGLISINDYLMLTKKFPRTFKMSKCSWGPTAQFLQNSASERVKQFYQGPWFYVKQYQMHYWCRNYHPIWFWRISIQKLKYTAIFVPSKNELIGISRAVDPSHLFFTFTKC